MGFMFWGGCELLLNVICVCEGGVEFELLIVFNFNLFGIVVQCEVFGVYLVVIGQMVLDDVLCKGDVLCLLLVLKVDVCCKFVVVFNDVDCYFLEVGVGDSIVLQGWFFVSFV